MQSYTRPMTAGDMRIFSGQISLDGIPQDITDWELILQADNIENLISIRKTVGSGVTITDALTGKFEVLINPIDTAMITASTKLSLEIEARPPLSGPYTVLRDTTIEVLPQAII